MFTEMREALSIPKSIDILDHIRSLPTAQKPTAVASIQAIERRAMTSQRPQPGLAEIMDYLTAKGIPKGLCTRNFPAPVTHLLSNYLPTHDFAPIITRDTVDIEPKPSPAGILHIAEKWNVQALDSPAVTEPDPKGPSAAEAAPPPSEAAPPTSDPVQPPEQKLMPLIMVGDSIDDMTAGYLAGAATVLLVNEFNAPLAEHEHTDLTIQKLDELIGILDRGFVGRT